MGAAQNFESVSRRPPDIEDYIDMMRRYRSWIVGPMFAGLVVSVVAGFLSQDTFLSYATMRISPPIVSEKLIPSVMSSTQLAEKLEQMKTDILSRGTLSDIIQKPSLDLYKKEQKRLPMEDVVQNMRKDIKIQQVESGGDRRLATAFQIQFKYTDKYKAAAVVRELVSRFENLNVSNLQGQKSMTNTFLLDEKNKAKERMDKLAAAITKFEMENQGRLPQQAQANSQAALQLQMQVMNISGQINRDNQDKLLLNTELDNLRNEQNYVSSNMEQTVAGSAPVALKNEKLLNLSKTISDLKGQLARAKNTFGENYPNIAEAQAQIDQLQAEEAELQKQDLQQHAATPGVAPRVVVNPQMEKQLQEYKSQESTKKTLLAAKSLEIEELTRTRADLEKQMAAVQRRIDEGPLNQQEYAQLLSDFQMEKQAYQDFQKKQEQSQTSQNLEEHKAGENLDVLDPPSLPDKAIDPPRLAWAGFGTFGGLVCGLILAAAKEVKNTALKNLKDVRAYTNLPVLSSIPLLENALLVRRKRRLVWLAWSSAIIVGITMMGGSMYYYMSSS